MCLETETGIKESCVKRKRFFFFKKEENCLFKKKEFYEIIVAPELWPCLTQSFILSVSSYGER